MRKILIGIIILALMMFAGCGISINRTGYDDTPTGAEDESSVNEKDKDDDGDDDEDEDKGKDEDEDKGKDEDEDKGKDEDEDKGIDEDEDIDIDEDEDKGIDEDEDIDIDIDEDEEDNENEDDEGDQNGLANDRVVECAYSYQADVEEIFYPDDNKIKYSIVQGKDGTKYSAELSYEEDTYTYNFMLHNSKGKELLNLSTHASTIYGIIEILDLNMDGYADIQFMVAEGAKNSEYELYIWDDAAQEFAKVICDEMLLFTDFEVHDGYLIIWGRNDSQSGVMIKYEWDKNRLVKVSEEEYHADE